MEAITIGQIFHAFISDAGNIIANGYIVTFEYLIAPLFGLGIVITLFKRYVGRK